MSDVKTLHERIAAIFSGALHLEVPSYDTDLFESGVLDSIAFVELRLQLEREFGVTTSVDDVNVATFRSIAAIADFVQARRVVPALTVSPWTGRVAAGH